MYHHLSPNQHCTVQWMVLGPTETREGCLCCFNNYYYHHETSISGWKSQSHLLAGKIYSNAQVVEMKKVTQKEIYHQISLQSSLGMFDMRTFNDFYAQTQLFSGSCHGQKFHLRQVTVFLYVHLKLFYYQFQTSKLHFGYSPATLWQL